MTKCFLFVDCDGVVAPILKDSSIHNKISCTCIKALQGLCLRLTKDSYEPQIILSSSWRSGAVFEGGRLDMKKASPQVQELEIELEHFHMTLSGKTPLYRSKSRDFEILHFMMQFPEDDFLVLDDDQSEFACSPQQIHLIECDPGIGFKELTDKQYRRLYQSFLRCKKIKEKLDTESGQCIFNL